MQHCFLPTSGANGGVIFFHETPHARCSKLTRVTNFSEEEVSSCRACESTKGGRWLERIEKYDPPCLPSCEMKAGTWKIDKCYPWAINRIICGWRRWRRDRLNSRCSLPSSTIAVHQRRNRFCVTQTRLIMRANKTREKRKREKRIQLTINFYAHLAARASRFRFLLIGCERVGDGEKKKRV